MEKVARIPRWLKFQIPGGEEYVRLKQAITALNLHTVCVEAKCPNIGECFCKGTATFMILGNVCTRNCRYCAVEKGTPSPPDSEEPKRVAEAVRQLGILYAVITSVTRDDLPDGGASIFACTVKKIRGKNTAARVEVLVPDFLHCGSEALDAVLHAQPDVFNHNIEVVRSLFPILRPLGNYTRSLEVLRAAERVGLAVKTGLMVGFGETMDDIRRTLEDVRNAGAAIITIGQYLQSHRGAYPVVKYYHPEEFEQMRQMALSLGFTEALCGPLVRSSYHAAEIAMENVSHYMRIHQTVENSAAESN